MTAEQEASYRFLWPRPGTPQADLLAEIDAERAVSAELLAAFKRMRQGYLNLAEMGLVSDSTKLSLEVYVAEADRLIAKVEGRV